MRRILVTLIISVLSKVCYAQFTVGSVQYSILPPDKFSQLNPGWVLMDGRVVPHSRLAAEMNDSLYRVPDARGMFLRAMNEGRDFNQGGDPDARRVGGYQPDGLGNHNHVGLYAPQGAEWANAYMQGPSGPVSLLLTNPQQSGKQSFQTGNSGIAETRPRNIALYLYIKIN